LSFRKIKTGAPRSHRRPENHRRSISTVSVAVGSVTQARRPLCGHGSQLLEWLEPDDQYRRFPKLDRPVMHELLGPLLGLFPRKKDQCG